MATRQTRTTTDHDEIRSWAEARCGRPATVKGTGEGRGGDEEEPGVLRIDFPGYRGMRTLQEITWEDFFDKFDQANLAFIYQEKTASGKPSRFCKLISRQDGGQDGGQKKRKTASSRRPRARRTAAAARSST